MPVTPLPYIAFAQDHYPGARFNLACSNVPPQDPSQFDVPQHVFNAEPGHLAAQAREVLASRYGVSPSQVVLTLGCSGANASMAALLGPGAALLVEQPGYEPMVATPLTLGLEVAPLPRTPDTWTLDPDRVEASLTPSTRAVWLTNPHNPSGTVLSAKTLQTLAERLGRRGILLYVDEVYLDFAGPLGELSAARLGDHVVISSSLTKVYGLGALRFGWMVAPEPIARQLNLLQIHLLGSPPSATLAIGLAALNDLEGLKERASAHLKDRHIVLERALTAAQGFAWTTPSVGIVGVLQISGVTDDMAFAQALIAQEEVTLAPGHFFGLPGQFRLGFGTTEAELLEGLERLTRFARAWREEGHG
ncbi:MAG: pyridoxal phosphate-dependent aminotransferase [Myxococcota bacterium]